MVVPCRFWTAGQRRASGKSFASRGSEIEFILAKLLLLDVLLQIGDQL